MRRLGIAVLLSAALAAAARPDIRIQTEEWRSQPGKHLFLHGTLDGATGFYVLLPEGSAWQGRLMHFLGGGMGGVADGGLKNGASGSPSLRAAACRIWRVCVVVR